MSLTFNPNPPLTEPDAAIYLNGGTASDNVDPLDIDTGEDTPVSNDPAGIVDSSAGASLSPDSILAYCESRLDSIDGQVGTLIQQQDVRNSEGTALSGVIQAFQAYSSGVTNDPGACTTMETSLYGLITNLKESDPTNPEIGKLEQLYNNLVYSGTGPTDALPYLDESTYPPAQNGPRGDNTLDTTEMQTFVSGLQGTASDLNSDSELQMIQIQSLMSQRQTAVELSTNIVQSLGDQAEKIAENVGH